MTNGDGGEEGSGGQHPEGLATGCYVRARACCGYRVHVPAHVDVKAVRTKLGMTQQTFAARFGFSINTLRHWEQGKREPEGPMRAYLLVIERAPRTVERALRIA